MARRGWGGSGRRGRLLGALVLVLVSAVMTPQPLGAGAPRTVDEWLATLTLEQRIAQLLVVRFKGPAMVPDVATMLHDQDAGGVTLYAKDGNVVDRKQLGRLTAALREASRVPLALVIDQEGGRVDRLKAVRGRRPSAERIARGGDPARAEAVGRGDAADLAELGFSVNLAPVLDVTRVTNPQLVERTFGTEPIAVARFAGAYLRGLQSTGRVIGVPKHFPGLGAVAEDPHQVLSHLGRSRAEIVAVDWTPYRALIARGDVHAIMVSHVIVAAIDADRPASLSPAVVTGGLRETLGFAGLIVADSLSMKGVTGAGTLGDVALQALLAGNDWLLGPESPDDVRTIVTRVARAVADGEIAATRIDASVRRVLDLKARVGLLR